MQYGMLIVYRPPEPAQSSRPDAVNAAAMRTPDIASLEVGGYLQLCPALAIDGLYDLKQVTRQNLLDYDLVAKQIERSLKKNEYIIDACGVIVSTIWVDSLREVASEKGHIRVTDFARERKIRRSVALCMIRRLLKGTYLSTSDTFFVRN